MSTIPIVILIGSVLVFAPLLIGIILCMILLRKLRIKKKGF